MFITHVNGPKEVVIAGLPAAVTAVVKQLDGYSAYRSPVSHVLHVPLLQRVAHQISALHDHPTTAPPDNLHLYTTSTYGRMTDFSREGLSRTITDVMCSEVDFVRLVDMAYDDGYRIFIECGPSATCSRWVNSCLTGRDYLSINLNQRGADDGRSLLAALARLVSHGVRVDLTSLVPGVKAERSKTVISLQPGGAALRATASETIRPLETNPVVALPFTPSTVARSIAWGPTAAFILEGTSLVHELLDHNTQDDDTQDKIQPDDQPARPSPGLPSLSPKPVEADQPFMAKNITISQDKSQRIAQAVEAFCSASASAIKRSCKPSPTSCRSGVSMPEMGHTEMGHMGYGQLSVACPIPQPLMLRLRYWRSRHLSQSPLRLRQRAHQHLLPRPPCCPLAPVKSRKRAGFWTNRIC